MELSPDKLNTMRKIQSIVDDIILDYVVGIKPPTHNERKRKLKQRRTN